MSDQQEQEEQDLLPLDRDYFYLPQVGEVCQIQLTQALAREYQTYAVLDGEGASSQENYQAARWVKEQAATGEASVEGSFYGVSEFTWTVQLQDGSTIELVDNLNSLVDLDTDDIPPGRYTGLILAANLKGLRPFNPEEHPDHEVISWGE